MYLNNLMNTRHISRAELVRASGVPDSTLRDILNGVAKIDHCEAGTLYGIAQALDISVEEILEHYWQDLFDEADCDIKAHEKELVHEDNSLVYFYMMVASTLDALGGMGDQKFVQDIAKCRWVESFYQRKCYRAALFLVGLIDYLYRKHNAKPDPRYDAYRKLQLDKPVYSLDTLDKNDDGFAFSEARTYAENHAVRELARFNIFMTEDEIRPQA